MSHPTKTPDGDTSAGPDVTPPRGETDSDGGQNPTMTDYTKYFRAKKKEAKYLHSLSQDDCPYETEAVDRFCITVYTEEENET